MGMTAGEFWKLTPWEFWLKVEGWQEQKQADKETAAYYQRYFATLLLNTQIKKPLKPKDLFLLSFEKSGIELTELSQEQVKQRLEDMARRVERAKVKRQLNNKDLIKWLQ